MPKARTRGQRAVALGIAATLIGGGATGLGTADQVPAATVSSVVAILVGLVFLRMAARGRPRG